MKKMKFYLWAFLMVFATLSFVACSDDDPDPGKPDNPDKPDAQVTTHFDLWVSMGGGSMTSSDAYLVRSVTDLTQGEIDFINEGVDVTELLHRETIVKGKYYYQIRADGTRFGKYRILENEIEVVAEFPFTTLKDRRHTHAWLDDKILVLIGSNGDSSKVLWVKVDTESMTIIGEGELDLPAPDADAKETFSTSGIAVYRKADGMILYSYLYNPTSSRNHFYMAFIDPADMSTKKIVKEERASFMAGTAFGELLQEKSFFTSNGDYYLACSNPLPDATSSTQQSGTLLRIKSGAMEFDPDFAIDTDSKIVVASNLDDSKALIYFQDPVVTGAPNWGSFFNCYYAILDLKNGAIPQIINGLPFCSGTFSQRSVIIDNKAYIGVYPETEEPAVYIYDIASGNLEKGLTIRQGYAFERILVLED
ncbi:MAG: DUF4374 domain-containing protein [Tannerellaceae bacterium]|nr:DUF4374 domain-containing protein [Tannerellaceae bacterium]